MIAWSFPPEAEVGALRAARFCQHLPDFGIEPIVVTAQRWFYKDCDATWPTPEGVRVVRTHVKSTPLDWYARWKRQLRPASSQSSNGGVPRQPVSRPGFLKRQVLTALQTPDRHWGWYEPAIRAAEKILREQRIDVLFSSGPPWLCHLIARKLKKRWKVPWIADFRDPWAYGTQWDPVPVWRQWIDRRLMESCIRTADRVVCNTDRFRERLLTDFPELPGNTFVTITNGVDETALPMVKAEPRPTKLLLHLGSLYGGRRIDTFCRAVRNLVENQTLDPSTFQVLFVGDMAAALVAGGEREAPELVKSKCIEFRKRVSWKEAQGILAEADQLLLFFDEEFAVPAKFYEYLQTGKPILAIAKPGALTDALTLTGSGLWADPDDPDEIAEKILAALSLQPRSAEEVQRSTKRYRAEVLATELSNLIRQLAVRQSSREHAYSR